MKKKILTSVIITVLFALLFSTISMVVLFNYKTLNSTKDSLRGFTNFVISLDTLNNNTLNSDALNDYRINNSTVRCTIIDKEGNVLYDSTGNELNSHNDREEVILAQEKNEGFSIRNSDTTGKRTVYYAVKLENGTIIRASLPYDTVDLLDPFSIKVIIMILLIVVLFSITLSLRLVKAIVDPIKDLENVTSRISKGDLNIRVNKMPKDEIGSLGNTFNNMAGQLQGKIREGIDKQNRIESILNSVESGVIALDLNNKVISINPYAKRVFGIKGEIINEDISLYINDYDINAFLGEDDESEKEVKIFHPIERDLRIRKSSIVEGAAVIGKVIAILDISDIKRLENMRSQFVANVSHELKTPLTSIKGFTETLKIVEDEETRMKFLNIIEKESERLSRLINDILVLSKIESHTNIKEEEFLPSSVVEEVISMLKPQWQEKDIDINYNNSCEDLLFGDRDRFLQLILNVIENAIKYNNVKGEVKVYSYSNKGYFYLSVKDNGIGIPKEDMAHIFERFYRVDKARKAGGTGLGLAIVKHIIKSFNGDIKVLSEVSKGTEFIIKIKHI